MDGNKDKLKGAVDKAKGEAKEQYGKLTDDNKKVVEGKYDKAKGEVKEKIGNLKDQWNDKDSEQDNQ